jgi:hypothetical protein
MSNNLVIAAPQRGAIARLEDWADEARGLMEEAKAENSRRGDRSEWRHFEKCAGAMGWFACPQHPRWSHST